MCQIVVGSHFANFGQNSQQFSLGSFLLQPPSTLQPLCNYAQNSIETLLLHLLKCLLKHFLKRLHWDDNILGIYWTSFVGFYYKDCIYWNIFEPHKVIEYVEKYDKNKKFFSANFQFLMMSVNKKSMVKQGNEIYWRNGSILCRPTSCFRVFL